MTSTTTPSRERGWSAMSLAWLPLALLACSGCGFLPFQSGTLGLVEGLLATTESSIDASVTAVSPDTGLPTTLSGTLSGQFQGTYQEQMLEVFFDATGVPVAAISRSEFTVDAPASGTLYSLNFVVVVDLILLTDDSGAPIVDAQGLPTVIGLHSAATGEIIHGTGDFAGVTGQLHTDSTLYLTGGDAGLGSLESDFVVELD